MLTGAIRFAIEFIRVNEQVVGPLSVAHIASVAVSLAGVSLLFYPWRASVASRVR